MRIDKFLKVSRLIKRREVAKELCEDSDVWVNGKLAKPSTEIKEGDEIKLALGRHLILVRVNQAKPFANKEQASSMYEIISDEIVERSTDA